MKLKEIIKKFALKGALSLANAKSTSTLVSTVVSASGVAYAAPPVTVEEYLVLLVSAVIGLAGFLYRQNH